ncbi:ethanolamine kinase 1-like isoform X2 [Lineus longissimus]|uniref:ethanolamine kinase 1-like isoform X2 n=1 Tax=Lineus longissimus TaxID=88925 RepID=UPI00315DBCE1
MAGLIMAQDVADIDVTVDKENYRDGLMQILLVIRPHWKAEEVRFKSMRQGYINLMLVCLVNDNQEEWLVARIFGSGLDPAGCLGFRRQREVKCSKALAELKLGPPVYASFRNGLIFGFVAGKQYGWADVTAFREMKTARAVARALAHLHSKRTTDYTLAKYGILEGQSHNTIMKQLLDNWPQVIIDEETTAWVNNQIPPLKDRQAEFDLLLNRFDALNIPETLCHGDPNPTNMIYNEQEDSIILVDYEMVGMMNPLYDLAGFMGTSAFGLLPDIESLEHTKDYQRTFVKEYLEKLAIIDKCEEPVTEDKIEGVYNIIQVMMMP